MTYKSTRETQKMKKVMGEFKQGTLKSGRNGAKVKRRGQAIAIGLSQARVAKTHVPPTQNVEAETIKGEDIKMKEGEGVEEITMESKSEMEETYIAYRIAEDTKRIAYKFTEHLSRTYPFGIRSSGIPLSSE